MGVMFGVGFSTCNERISQWFEKLSTVTLVAAIMIIGMTPFWLSDLIRESLDMTVKHLTR